MLNEWLNIAKLAPSGGNVQPWRVKGYEDSTSVQICLDIDPRLHQGDSPFSAGGMAHIYALGGFAFILEQIALAYGFKLKESITAHNERPLEAQFFLNFEKFGPPQLEKVQEIQQQFQNRHTNRSPYTQTLLKVEHQELVAKVAAKYPNLILKTYIKTRNQMAKLILELDYVRWTNSDFINGLFQELALQDDRSELGITADTLGAPASAVQFLRFWQNHRWVDKVVKRFLKYPLAKDTFTNLIQHSGGMYFVQAKDNSLLSAFSPGRFFTQVWSELNQSGVSFQPLGTPLIAFGYHHSLPQIFSLQEAKTITHSSEKLKRTQALDVTLPAMGFRVGYTSTKAGISNRKEILWTKMEKKLNFELSAQTKLA